MNGEVYTGNVTYRNIDFNFVLNGDELRLIPPKDKEHEIEWQWTRKRIGSGAYSWADPISIEEDFLIGFCNETKQKIIFLPQQGSFLGFQNVIVKLPITAYILFKHERDQIDFISFTCPELNHIHPINTAFSIENTLEDFANNGIISLSTQDFDSTTTATQSFYVNGKNVEMYFDVYREVSIKIEESPLKLKAALNFVFEPTNDYRFILRLWQIARNFIRFLCYRRNVYIPTVRIGAPEKEGKHDSFATMYILEQEGDVEIDALKNGYLIKQIYISNHEGDILSDIAADNLYLRHLPETYQSGRHIDAARFIMITAAFEWEFHRLYKDGVKKSLQKIEAEELVSETIQNHIENSSGKQRAIYKFLKKLVKSDSLQAEIMQVGKDFSGILDPFGKRLYHQNGQELKYSEMGQRLADQRNHFAHGDLDKDFIGLSLLDVVFMKYMVYAMQLRYYGIADTEIQRAVNELFHLGFAI